MNVVGLLVEKHVGDIFDMIDIKNIKSIERDKYTIYCIFQNKIK